MLDINEIINSDKLFDGHYRLIRPLNTEGGTADVWLAVDMNTIDGHSVYDEESLVIDESSALLVAIKIYRPKNALDIEGEQRFRDEFKVAFNCHHANLLQPTSFNIFQGVPYLVLPYCENGSAEQFIRKKISKEKIWKFVLDVASGLDRLHTNNPQIVHQDIKPANILIDDSGNFTITDFGISAKKSSGQDYDGYEENSGTLAYMAPERFESNGITLPESDIWAFGATLCEILTGRVPFGEDGGQRQLVGKTPKPELAGVSSELKALIWSCLQKDPKKRPTARQIMETAAGKIASRKKKWPTAAISSVVAVAAIIALVVLLGGNKSDIDIVVNKPDFDQAQLMLATDSTAKKGLDMLLILDAENDYQATYLLSRLYFNSSDDRDTLFYDGIWNTMRKSCNITHNNETAHNYLLKAVELNDTIPIPLFQLGNDYLSGRRRGCERNLNYALWCFNRADSLLVNYSDPESIRCKDNIVKSKLIIQRSGDRDLTPKSPLTKDNNNNKP